MKNYFENLLALTEAIIALTIFVAPVVISMILVLVYRLSPLWFLLDLLYIPIGALIMTWSED